MDHQASGPQSPGDHVDAPARPRAQGDVPSERKCMSCSEPFHSDGWHNRLCPRCRKRSEPEGC